MGLPEVEKVSKLIDALRDYAVNSARAYYEENPADRYLAPCLASWDSFAWFELVQDWEIIDFLISGTREAKLLVRSLQSCLQWYGQTEVDEIIARLSLMSIIN
jgi:hypothetical protein